MVVSFIGGGNRSTGEIHRPAGNHWQTLSHISRINVIPKYTWWKKGRRYQEVAQYNQLWHHTTCLCFVCVQWFDVRGDCLFRCYWWNCWRETFDHKIKMWERQTIRVITKLPNSEQSYKGKVKTHKYINRQNQSTTGKLWKQYEVNKPKTK